MQTPAYLEHTNLTVANPEATANLLCELFDWKIRWQGPSMDDGYTVHVGSETSYLSLYTNKTVCGLQERNHSQLHNLNHIAIVVSDLDDISRKLKKRGYEPFNYADYEPGKRFYFYAAAGLEIEVVNYS